MRRYRPGFTAPLLILFLFMSTVVFTTAMAKPDSESSSTDADKVEGGVHNNQTDSQESEETETLEPYGRPGSNNSDDRLIPATSPANNADTTPTKVTRHLPNLLTSPFPTGPSPTTKQPFHVLAPDVEYFDYDSDTDIDSTTQPEIPHNATTCQCPTGDPPTSVTIATVITPAPPPLDEIDALEKAIQSICLRLRQKVEDSARNKTDNLVNLRDACSVTLEYRFNVTFMEPNGSLNPYLDPLKAVTKLRRKFSHDNVTDAWTWKEAEKKQRQKGKTDSLRTQLEKFERKVPETFKPVSYE